MEEVPLKNKYYYNMNNINLNTITTESDINILIKQLIALYREKLNKAVSDNSPLKNFTMDLKVGKDYIRISINTESYWQYMENGRRPGKQPPIQPILDWIEIRKIVPKSTNQHPPTSKQLAFAISKSIAKNGTEGKHILNNSIYSPKGINIIKKLQENIAKSIEVEIVNQTNDEIIEEFSK